MAPIIKSMDKTQIYLFSLYSPEDFILKINQSNIFRGVDREWQLDNWQISDYDLLICLQGEAWYKDKQGPHHMTRGKAYLARPDYAISSHLGPDKEFHVLAQHFSLSLLGGRDPLAGTDFSSMVALNHFPLVEEYLKILDSPDSSPFVRETLFRTILWDFLDNSLKETPFLGKSDRTKVEEGIITLAHYIKMQCPSEEEFINYQGDLGLSPVYIRDLFRSHFGKTPRQYWIEQRLQKARTLLREGHSVKETAHLCGFSDELYFARLFKKKEGLSPGRFARRTEM